MDKEGNLYGTAAYGGSFGQGTVFKMDASGNETTLYSFMNLPDGANPLAGLVIDGGGHLYGTTANGGDLNCTSFSGVDGCGIVFKLNPTGKETVLHTFTGPDGAFPFAGLVMDQAGNLYGDAGGGGDFTCGPGFGCGIVFKLNPTGKETVLHTFTGPDGAFPMASLMESGGNLYGTASGGGASGDGTVFKLAP